MTCKLRSPYEMQPAVQYATTQVQDGQHAHQRTTFRRSTPTLWNVSFQVKVEGVGTAIKDVITQGMHSSPNEHCADTASSRCLIGGHKGMRPSKAVFWHKCDSTCAPCTQIYSSGGAR